MEDEAKNTKFNIGREIWVRREKHVGLGIINAGCVAERKERQEKEKPTPEWLRVTPLLRPWDAFLLG